MALGVFNRNDRTKFSFYLLFFLFFSSFYISILKCNAGSAIKDLWGNIRSR